MAIEELEITHHGFRAKTPHLTPPRRRSGPRWRGARPPAAADRPRRRRARAPPVRSCDGRRAFGQRARAVEPAALGSSSRGRRRRRRPPVRATADRLLAVGRRGGRRGRGRGGLVRRGPPSRCARPGSHCQAAPATGPGVGLRACGAGCRSSPSAAARPRPDRAPARARSSQALTATLDATPPAPVARRSRSGRSSSGSSSGSQSPLRGSSPTSRSGGLRPSDGPAMDALPPDLEALRRTLAAAGLVKPAPADGILSRVDRAGREFNSGESDGPPPTSGRDPSQPANWAGSVPETAHRPRPNGDQPATVQRTATSAAGDAGAAPAPDHIWARSRPAGRPCKERRPAPTPRRRFAHPSLPQPRLTTPSPLLQPPAHLGAIRPSRRPARRPSNEGRPRQLPTPGPRRSPGPHLGAIRPSRRIGREASRIPQQTPPRSRRPARRPSNERRPPQQRTPGPRRHRSPHWARSVPAGDRARNGDQLRRPAAGSHTFRCTSLDSQPRVRSSNRRHVWARSVSAGDQPDDRPTNGDHGNCRRRVHAPPEPTSGRDPSRPANWAGIVPETATDPAENAATGPASIQRAATTATADAGSAPSPEPTSGRDPSQPANWVGIVPDSAPDPAQVPPTVQRTATTAAASAGATARAARWPDVDVARASPVSMSPPWRWHRRVRRPPGWSTATGGGGGWVLRATYLGRRADSGVVTAPCPLRAGEE